MSFFDDVPAESFAPSPHVLDNYFVRRIACSRPNASVTVSHSSPPRCAIDDVEYATTKWVDWLNNWRLHSQLNYVPPDEYEAAYYAHRQASPTGTPDGEPSGGG